MVWIARAAVAAVLAGASVGVLAQQPAPWTVKPEWVKAHEEFLASDVLAGRGSATRDEEIAATYVASEFEGYGLKTAPGMSSYIQSAELQGPMLNGHAQLVAGDQTFVEGKDFDLLMVGGGATSGRVLKVPASDAGSKSDLQQNAVLLTDVATNRALGSARELSGAQAAMILLPEDASTDRMLTMFGGKPRVPAALKEGQLKPGRGTVLALYPEAYKKLLAVKQSSPISLKLFGTNQTERKTYNAIGYLKGTDPNAGTILLTAHLDHLGTGKPVNGDGIWNGANDDAAGTTAVLEMAHALAAGPKLRRSVLFVCYGSEEMGEFGSLYFGAHSPVPLKELIANLEFEMIGNQDPKMPKGVLLLTGYDRSNLGPTLKEHGALVGPDPYPEEHFFERSDNYQLALKGVVAHTAAGWGTVPTYHQPDDDLAHLDLPFMTTAIQSLIEPIRWLASSDFVPKWNHGGQPKGD
ncbi:MAG: M28 family peptidase [Acidobacteriaceae bacterium]|nr:M28 family peptidase [Acidobacteriaceae bacterium]